MEQQIYRDMANALDYDLGDVNNPVSEMVRIGIDDFDPTRVLQDCEHMFLALGRQGHTRCNYAKVYRETPNET
jgi:3-deoxy-D-arabino-heptulosonate 7-phosphate (DAHP) synthase